MTEAIDAAGRWVIVAEENCIHCNRSSVKTHPFGGVVPGRWKCMCGLWQNPPYKRDARDEDGA
jgi:hypothetical protein